VENQMIAPSLVLLACSLLWGDDLPILSAIFTVGPLETLKKELFRPNPKYAATLPMPLRPSQHTQCPSG
jgi:hypothetical protein